MRRRYLISVEVEVVAESTEEAESEVLSLLSYAFEVSNDEGRFKSYRLHESSDPIDLGEDRPD